MSKQAVMLIALFLFTGCAESATESGSGSNGSGVTLGMGLSDGTPSDSEIVFEDEAGIAYSITEARAWLRDIELDMPAGTRCSAYRDVLAGGAVCKSASDDDRDHDRDDDSDDRGTILIDGPFLVDLVTGESTPSLDSVRIPALAYERIDFRMEPADDGTGLIARNDLLVDNSLVVLAGFALDGSDSELVLTFDFTEDVRFEGLAGGRVSDGDSLELLLDVSGWFDGVDMASCVRNAESDACEDIEDIVKDNIKRSGRLEHHDDRDDEDEHEDEHGPEHD